MKKEHSVFTDGKNIIVCSDVLNYLKGIENESVDLIIADPLIFKSMRNLILVYLKMKESM